VEANQVSRDDKIWKTKVDLAAVLRTAARLNLHEGVDNHFSAVVPGVSDRFLINPHRQHWSEICASDIVEVDHRGKTVGGKKPPEATAFFIHSRIHMICPHAKCILHTHMQYATALSMLDGVRLEPVVQGALKFYGQISYYEEFGGLALGNSEGDSMAEALGDRRILFLANHGVIVVGPTIAHAFNDLYYLEQVCRAQITAMSAGVPLKRIPQDVAQHTHEQMQKDRNDQATHHFAAMKRQLDREEPEYAF
tara:strand:+ start:1898 stop:2650 length:753 start_codon:yes stop_codon:yes gene_type:complete